MFRPVFFASSPKPKIGEIVAYGGATVPTGWKECNGDSLERAAYTELFAVIGGSWGTADSTHFNIPDLRGRFIRGWSDTSSNDPDKTTRTAHATGGVTGNEVGTIQAEAIYGHLHSWNGATGGVSNNTGAMSLFTWWAGCYAGYSATEGSETRPKNAYVRYCIKYI